MKKRAFTMIEVIVVIILFGIIAGIGAEMISKMYRNYIQSRTLNYLQSQSDITVEQIAKRLQYRIKDTAIARNGNQIRVLNHPDVDENYNIVEWIGYSNEALLGIGGNNPPAWSGFIDLDNLATSSTTKTLSTPGSNLNDLATIIGALYYGDNTKANNLALIFKQKPTGFYDPNNEPGYGWRNLETNNVNPNYLLDVSVNGATTFTINNAITPDQIYEHYYLAHTAYAIVRNGGADDNFNLELKYNYKPWRGETRDNGATAILAENVNLFRIQQIGNTIRIKLCLHDNDRSGAGRKLVACKEEVIF